MNGWFADIEDEGDYWQAFLQNDIGCFPLDGIWFQSKEQCEEFIRTDILGKEMI